jgi:hypothetical protein
VDDLDYVLSVIDPWISKYIRDGASALTDREAIGVGVWLLQAEVNNGGFDQYYSNTRGALAKRTVAALEEIGATDTASVLAAANADIPSLPLPEHRESRFGVLDQVQETCRWSALETEFYQERENLMALLAAYLRRTEGCTALREKTK